jgi:hypothetical protein
MLTPVLIDDFFPLGADSEPLMTRPGPNSDVWAMLIEKALQKLLRGVENDSVHTLLTHLTG